MTQLLVYIFQFSILILGEYFSARARAREEDRIYKVSQVEFEAMSARCVAKMREWNRKESGQAQDLEDRMDQNRPKPGGEA